jgi:hypothetical protein
MFDDSDSDRINAKGVGIQSKGQENSRMLENSDSVQKNSEGLRIHSEGMRTHSEGLRIHLEGPKEALLGSRNTVDDQVHSESKKDTPFISLEATSIQMVTKGPKKASCGLLEETNSEGPAGALIDFPKVPNQATTGVIRSWMCRGAARTIKRVEGSAQ